MNCRLNIATSRRSDRGFTMIEIAIALGVIGFALVAIIGILPMGLDVQRDNRSETIINQDATLWLEAIRSGAVGMNDLPSYVENISLIERNPADGGMVASNRYVLGNGSGQTFKDGADIIGLLTWAASGPDREARAQITALSGSAAEKELDPAKRALAFSYLLRVVIDARRDPNIDFNDTALPFDAVTGEEMLTIRHFGYSSLNRAYPDATSLSEIRLTFAYPFIGENRPPPRAQTYRASVARQIVNDPDGSEFFFFRP